MSSLSSSSSSANSAQFYRLPKISLPSFSGDILQWQSFGDSYESIIHCNANLTNAQKFTYLNSQLEGAAACVIEGFTMTNANYTHAIDFMKERFGKQRRITHATMQPLLKLPAPSNKVSSLRHFNDKMETYIRSFEAMGQSEELYGSLLVPVVLDKMPGEICKQSAQENGGNDWLLRDLHHAINRKIGILEAGTTHSEPEINDYFTQERDRGREHSKTRDHQMEGKSQEQRSSVHFARAGTGSMTAALTQTLILG